MIYTLRGKSVSFRDYTLPVKIDMSAPVYMMKNKIYIAYMYPFYTKYLFHILNN